MGFSNINEAPVIGEKWFLGRVVKGWISLGIHVIGDKERKSGYKRGEEFNENKERKEKKGTEEKEKNRKVVINARQKNKKQPKGKEQ